MLKGGRSSVFGGPERVSRDDGMRALPKRSGLGRKSKGGDEGRGGDDWCVSRFVKVCYSY